GPSTSGKPWPRFTDPVRIASADISVKIVGGIPCSRFASMRPTLATGPGGRVPGVDETLPADIDALCRLTGEFTLRSGQQSTEYFDKYLFESDPQLLLRVAREMVGLLPPGTDLLGGLELGGIPIATMLSSLTGRPAL